MQCLPNQVDGQAFLQMQVRAVQLHIQLGRRDGQVLTDFLRRERQPLQLSRLCEVAVGLEAPAGQARHPHRPQQHFMSEMASGPI